MLKRVLTGWLVLALVVVSFLVAPITDVSAEEHPRTWNVLVYMSAADDLDPLVDEDLEQLAQCVEGDPVNVFALVHRLGTTTKIYQVFQDELVILEDLGDATSRQRTTLERFLEVAEEEAEADHTLVVFWGHGGPTRAASLSHEVIVELCKDLDVLAYDACMVGQIETVKLYADGDFEGYMVANLGYISWRGFPYHFILQRLLAENPDSEELAIIMVEEFSNYLNRPPYMSEVQTSQAVINVKEIGGVVESFETLVTLLTEGMRDHRPQVRNARSAASQAWGNNIYIDLQVFVEEIRNRIKVGEITEACNALISDIEEMIVAVGTTIKTDGKVKSIGVYFPSGHNQVSQSRLNMYTNVSLGCWVRFLEAYYTPRGHV